MQRKRIESIFFSFHPGVLAYYRVIHFFSYLKDISKHFSLKELYLKFDFKVYYSTFFVKESKNINILTYSIKWVYEVL